MTDVKLPETTAAFQEARREAFEAGSEYGACNTTKVFAPKAEAKRRYPITRQVPREVRAGRYVLRVTLAGGIEGKYSDSVYWHPLAITVAEAKAVADLIANPFETVTE